MGRIGLDSLARRGCSLPDAVIFHRRARGGQGLMISRDAWVHVLWRGCLALPAVRGSRGCGSPALPDCLRKRSGSLLSGTRGTTERSVRPVGLPEPRRHTDTAEHHLAPRLFSFSPSRSPLKEEKRNKLALFVPDSSLAGLASLVSRCPRRPKMPESEPATVSTHSFPPPWNAPERTPMGPLWEIAQVPARGSALVETILRLLRRMLRRE